jgi:hypothetical protein
MKSQATQSPPRPPPPRRWRALHVLLWIVASFLGVAIVVRLVLDPIASHEVRKGLDGLDGYVGDFEKVHVSVLGPGFEIWRFKLAEARATEKGGEKALAKDPLIFVEHARLGANWRALLHGRLEGRLRLESPKIVVVQTEKAKPSAKPAAPDLSEQLRKALPLRVSRIEVVHGEMLFRMRQSGGAEPAELWLHEIEVAAENLGTRRKLMHGRPATVNLHAVLGRSGELTAFASADPLASPLSFAGEVALRGFHAEELYDFVAPKTGMKTDGTVDLFVSFESRHGAITGGIKPVLKDIDLSSVKPGTWDRLKAWLADKSVDIASDRVPGRNAVATTIPIKGKLTDPDIQIWPAVLGVIRNAFVEGLVSGFANVPPATAGEKESVWKQAKDALKRDKGPPHAQPTN